MEIKINMARTTVNPASAGGLALVRQRGTNYMSKIGRRGGNTVVDTYGVEFMSLLGTLASPSLSQRRRRQIERTIAEAVEIANS